jgi:hypothetical protein
MIIFMFKYGASSSFHGKKIEHIGHSFMITADFPVPGLIARWYLPFLSHKLHLYTYISIYLYIYIYVIIYICNYMWSIMVHMYRHLPAKWQYVPARLERVRNKACLPCGSDCSGHSPFLFRTSFLSRQFSVTSWHH